MAIFFFVVGMDIKKGPQPSGHPVCLSLRLWDDLLPQL